MQDTHVNYEGHLRETQYLRRLIVQCRLAQHFYLFQYLHHLDGSQHWVEMGAACVSVRLLSNLIGLASVDPCASAAGSKAVDA